MDGIHTFAMTPSDVTGCYPERELQASPQKLAKDTESHYNYTQEHDRDQASGELEDEKGPINIELKLSSNIYNEENNLNDE